MCLPYMGIHEMRTKSIIKTISHGRLKKQKGVR